MKVLLLLMLVGVIMRLSWAAPASVANDADPARA
jgi:hypothetical protein